MELSKSIVELATAVFIALGASCYGRIDISLGRARYSAFPGANLVPGPGTARLHHYFHCRCRLNYANGLPSYDSPYTGLAFTRNLSVYPEARRPEVDDLAPPSLKPAFGVL